MGLSFSLEQSQKAIRPVRINTPDTHKVWKTCAPPRLMHFSLLGRNARADSPHVSPHLLCANRFRRVRSRNSRARVTRGSRAKTSPHFGFCCYGKTSRPLSATEKKFKDLSSFELRWGSAHGAPSRSCSASWCPLETAVAYVLASDLTLSNSVWTPRNKKCGLEGRPMCTASIYCAQLRTVCRCTSYVVDCNDTYLDVRALSCLHIHASIQRMHQSSKIPPARAGMSWAPAVSGLCAGVLGGVVSVGVYSNNVRARARARGVAMCDDYESGGARDLAGGARRDVPPHRVPRARMWRIEFARTEHARARAAVRVRVPRMRALRVRVLCVCTRMLAHLYGCRMLMKEIGTLGAQSTQPDSVVVAARPAQAHMPHAHCLLCGTAQALSRRKVYCSFRRQTLLHMCVRMLQVGAASQLMALGLGGILLGFTCVRACVRANAVGGILSRSFRIDPRPSL